MHLIQINKMYFDTVLSCFVSVSVIYKIKKAILIQYLVVLVQ